MTNQDEVREEFYGMLLEKEKDTPEPVSIAEMVDWWLQKFDTLLAKKREEIEKLETTFGVDQYDSYQIGQNHGRQEMKAKVLSILS